MSNTARAVTRPRRAHRYWRVRAAWVRYAEARPVNWRTPAPGRPLPHFQVTRPEPKRRGGQVVAMTYSRRDANYQRQTGMRVTPAQARRIYHKANHGLVRDAKAAQS